MLRLLFVIVLLLTLQTCIAEGCDLTITNGKYSTEGSMGKWSGSCINGLAQGFGYAKDKDSNYFFGEAYNGHPTGKGVGADAKGRYVITLFDQGALNNYVTDSYYEAWGGDDSKLPKEECHLYNPNWNTFGWWQGSCQGKLATGRGFAAGYPNVYYYGDAVNGKPHGRCIILSSGNIFEGTCDQGNRVTGTITTFRDGNSFKGSFRGNEPYEGATYDSNGNVGLSGRFAVSSDGTVYASRDDSLVTLIGGVATMVFVGATGAVLVGGAARAAIMSAPLRVLVVVIK